MVKTDNEIMVTIDTRTMTQEGNIKDDDENKVDTTPH